MVNSEQLNVESETLLFLYCFLLFTFSVTVAMLFMIIRWPVTIQYLYSYSHLFTEKIWIFVFAEWILILLFGTSLLITVAKLLTFNFLFIQSFCVLHMCSWIFFALASSFMQFSRVMLLVKVWWEHIMERLFCREVQRFWALHRCISSYT